MVFNYGQFGISPPGSAPRPSPTGAPAPLAVQPLSASQIAALQQNLKNLESLYLGEQRARIAVEKERDSAVTLANTRTEDLNKATEESNRRAVAIQNLEARLNDSTKALEAATRSAALVPALEAQLKQINDAAARIQQERDNAVAETGRVRAEAAKDVENQRSIGQRMLDEANKSAAARLAQAQTRLADLERGKLGVEALASDLQQKLEKLRKQYDERTAADAAQAKSALEAAQADLQKARDVCAAELGAAAEAKRQAEALLAAAQDEASKCALREQTSQPVTAAPAKPGISPAIALVGGIIAGFAVSKVQR